MSKCIVTRAKSSKENLCDTCKLKFPTCEYDEELIEFGDGRGHDNIIACSAYKARLSRPEKDIIREEPLAGIIMAEISDTDFRRAVYGRLCFFEQTDTNSIDTLKTVENELKELIEKNFDSKERIIALAETAGRAWAMMKGIAEGHLKQTRPGVIAVDLSFLGI